MLGPTQIDRLEAVIMFSCNGKCMLDQVIILDHVIMFSCNYVIMLNSVGFVVLQLE